MRGGYARKRLRQAAAAVAAPDGDIRAALYAAHLQLHTILPEHLPDGEPRRRLSSIHARFTHRHPDDPTAGGVIDVIRRLGDAAAVALASDIRALWDAVAAIPDEPLHPGGAAASSGQDRDLRPLDHPRVPPGGRVLIVFGSTDGHTRALAEFAGASLVAAGHPVEVRHAPLAREISDVELFAGVFIAASIHWTRYQSSVISFAKAHHEALNARPSAFISVSLSAAGIEQPEAATLDDYVEALLQETEWEPEAVHHVAGRIRHSGYDYFKRLATTMIARRRGDAIDPTRDYDLADYPALEAFVRCFIAGTIPDEAAARGAGVQAGPDAAAAPTPSRASRRPRPRPAG